MVDNAFTRNGFLNKFECRGSCGSPKKLPKYWTLARVNYYGWALMRVCQTNTSHHAAPFESEVTMQLLNQATGSHVFDSYD